jgi:hypothetical protein
VVAAVQAAAARGTSFSASTEAEVELAEEVARRAGASLGAAAGRHRAVRAGDRPPRPGAHELVFLADLTVELRAWPTNTWSKVGIDPQAAAARWWPAGSAATYWACGWAG